MLFEKKIGVALGEENDELITDYSRESKCGPKSAQVRCRRSKFSFDLTATLHKH